MTNTRIFIVDDHPLVCEGLRNMLEQEAGITVLGAANSGTEALEALRGLTPDIVFLDINLPDINGIDLCKTIRQEWPAIKCIALSTFGERSYISRMIENGASGYLLKNAAKEEILQAIHQVGNGGMYLNMLTQQSASTIAAEPVPFITRREKEVLKHIADGFTNQQIADKLFVSVTTINTHRKNLLMKFEVNNTAALMKVALQHELL
jgi:DNA-binding NarL/FixJ family response regulator